MYGSTSREFQEKMSGWTKNTPLAAVRPGVDSKEFVDNASFAGGRPVSTFSFHLQNNELNPRSGIRGRSRRCDRHVVHTRLGMVYWQHYLCERRLQIQQLNCSFNTRIRGALLEEVIHDRPTPSHDLARIRVDQA